MEEKIIEVVRKDEKRFVDFILDLMYINPVHAGIEFPNFSIHFDGSDDIKDQKDFINNITDYMSVNPIIPCLVTLNDLGLTVSNIERVQYAVKMDFDPPLTETIDEPPEVADEPQVDNEPDDEQTAPDDDEPKKPTFLSLLGVLTDIFSSGQQQIRKVGDFNVMEIPGMAMPVINRYAFSGSNNIVYYIVYEEKDGKIQCTISSPTSSHTFDANDYIEYWYDKCDISKEFMDYLRVLQLVH